MKKEYIYLIIGGAIVLAYVIYTKRQALVEDIYSLNYDPSTAVYTSDGAINNPMNIKQGELWVGLIDSPSQTFCSFSDMSYSFRAATRIFNTYISEGRASTLQDCITIYAPSSDNNNPASYTQTIVNATGIPASTPMSTILNNQTSTVAVLTAMASVEQGGNFGQQASVQTSAQNGYNLA